jgi:hypothetical protein
VSSTEREHIFGASSAISAWAKLVPPSYPSLTMEGPNPEKPEGFTICHVPGPRSKRTTGCRGRGKDKHSIERCFLESPDGDPVFVKQPRFTSTPIEHTLTHRPYP